VIPQSVDDVVRHTSGCPIQERTVDESAIEREA
jgi:hypothetical protein